MLYKRIRAEPKWTSLGKCDIWNVTFRHSKILKNRKLSKKITAYYQKKWNWNARWWNLSMMAENKQYFKYFYRRIFVSIRVLLEQNFSLKTNIAVTKTLAYKKNKK